MQFEGIAGTGSSKFVCSVIVMIIASLFIITVSFLLHIAKRIRKEAGRASWPIKYITGRDDCDWQPKQIF